MRGRFIGQDENRGLTRAREIFGHAVNELGIDAVEVVEVTLDLRHVEIGPLREQLRRPVIAASLEHVIRMLRMMADGLNQHGCRHAFRCPLHQFHREAAANAVAHEKKLLDAEVVHQRQRVRLCPRGRAEAGHGQAVDRPAAQAEHVAGLDGHEQGQRRVEAAGDADVQGSPARELLDLVGLIGREEIWARRLSYGDQRRLEIARALAARPKLLLLDEPTAGMGDQETYNITRLIRQLHQDHKLSIVLIDLLLAGDLDAFGLALHRGWEMKRGLSDQISTSAIDELYARARAAGALGGKIAGAGGGGFLVLYCPKPAQTRVRQALTALQTLEFRFDWAGARIAFAQ